MDETKQANQEGDSSNQAEAEGQKLEKLEHDIEELEKKAVTPPAEPTSPAASPASTPPSTGKSRIVLWAGLGLLLLALVATGAYSLGSRKVIPTPTPIPSPVAAPTPTPFSEITSSTEISDWKAYVDNGQKYSFSFPPNWILRTGNPNQLYNYDLEAVSRTHFDPELDKDKVKIEIYTSSKRYDFLETFAKEQEKTTEEIRGESVEVDYETIFVDNQKTLKTVDDFPLGFRTLIIYVQNPSTKLIHAFIATPRYDLHTKIVDQILSTFKFLEATPEASPTGIPSGTITP